MIADIFYEENYIMYNLGCSEMTDIENMFSERDKCRLLFLLLYYVHSASDSNYSLYIQPKIIFLFGNIYKFQVTSST